MKNYPHIAQKLYNEEWLITKAKHETLCAVFEAHSRGEKAGLFDDDEEDKDTESKPRLIGQTQVVPVHGVLGKHLSSLEVWCGGCSVDAIGQQLDKAESDYRVKNVLMDFRTPGGVVTGIPELGQKIASMSKDVWAFTDIECCSGGIWLASQADKFYCTESAMVGSVGVYSIYLDRSKQLDEAGIKVNAISAGEFKLAGAPFKKMTEDERAMFQSRTDAIYTKFKEAITSKRQIDDEFLQGQVFYGDEAAAVGMVDGLVESFEDVIDMMR
jgi:signal peptide peptidase SppA